MATGADTQGRGKSLSDIWKVFCLFVTHKHVFIYIFITTKFPSHFNILLFLKHFNAFKILSEFKKTQSGILKSFSFSETGQQNHS